MARIDLTLRIILADPPSGLVFSLQGRANAPMDAVFADGGDLTFDIPITLTPTADGLRPGGPFLRADSRGRFVYIASGAQATCAAPSGSGRRAKIYLNALSDEPRWRPPRPPSELSSVVRPGARDGGAACATVPLLQTWTRVRPS